jgi:hypothetical protein
MYLIFKLNFKAFGYYLPFWRKMQTKLKLQNENRLGIWHVLGMFFGDAGF